MNPINKNEIVQLKSGGPKMTVQRFIGEKTMNYGVKIADETRKLKGFNDGDAVCQWFDGSDLKEGVFPVEALRKIED
jgi:uncharacterized protein YodC (DUF2158 family)